MNATEWLYLIIVVVAAPPTMTDWMPLLIAATPPTILGGGTLLLGWLTSRRQEHLAKEQMEANAKIEATRTEVEKVHGVLGNIELKVDGRLDRLTGLLLEATNRASHAEGVKEEKERPT